MIEPPFAALLADSACNSCLASPSTSRNIKFTRNALGNHTPLGDSALQVVDDGLVLFLRPRSFHEPRLQHFGPTMQTLNVAALAIQKSSRNQLPVSCSNFRNCMLRLTFKCCRRAQINVRTRKARSSSAVHFPGRAKENKQCNYETFGLLHTLLL